MTAPNPVNVIAYYKLDENTGTTADNAEGTSSLDGSASNARIFTSEITGIINTGADFTQGNDYIDIGSALRFQIDEEFTLSFWIKRNSITAGESWFSSYGLVTGGYRGFQTRISSNKLEIRLGNEHSGSVDNFLITTVNDIDVSNTDFDHIVITYSGNSDANGFSIYKNNNLMSYNVNSNTATNIIDYGSLTSYISGDGSSRFINSYVDEVGIFNVALTSAQISYLYDSGSPGTDQQYPFTPPPFTITTNAASNLFSDQATLNGGVSDLE